MTITIELAQKIRLLSDGELYEEAITLAERHRRAKVSETQLKGIQNAVGTGDLNEVFDYIDNRLERETTHDQVKKFYKDLKVSLKNLPKLTTEACDCLLAKEFIQHVVVEYKYQRELSNA